MIIDKLHRWKLSWPGNYCLDCGISDPYESDDALINCDCQPPEDLNADNGCKKCLGTGCLPNPDLVCPPCPGVVDF